MGNQVQEETKTTKGSTGANTSEETRRASSSPHSARRTVHVWAPAAKGLGVSRSARYAARCRRGGTGNRTTNQDAPGSSFDRGEPLSTNNTQTLSRAERAAEECGRGRRFRTRFIAATSTCGDRRNSDGIGTGWDGRFSNHGSRGSLVVFIQPRILVILSKLETSA
jgi:hypothetical protein